MKRLFVPVLVLLVLSVPTMAKTLSPDDMVKVADEARFALGDTTFVVTVKDYTKGTLQRETRYRVLSRLTRDDSAKSIVETIFPERLTGRKLLMRGNDLWIYLPTVKRPTRISFREKLTGEVSNGDVARTDYARDYSARALGVESSQGHKWVKLELSARNKDVTYSRIVYWLEQGNWRPAKAEYYAVSGKLLKTAVFEDYRPVLGSVRATRMIIRDALQPSRESRLYYSEQKRANLSESVFSKESLSQ